MNDEKLRKLIDGEFRDVKVPEGLEDRLSATIDSLASKEEAASGRDAASRPKAARKAFSPSKRWISIAATVAIVAVSAGLAVIGVQRRNNQLADTCRTADEAYVETERALQMVSSAYNRGMKQVDASVIKMAETQETVEKQLTLKNNEKR